MKCPNCGNTNENPNNKFCTYCGTKLDNNEQNNQEQDKGHDNGGISTGAVAGIASAFVFYQKKD